MPQLVDQGFQPFWFGQFGRAFTQQNVRTHGASRSAETVSPSTEFVLTRKPNANLSLLWPDLLFELTQTTIEVRQTIV